MYDYINKEYIKNHNFKYIGLNPEEQREKASYMLGPNAVLPMDDRKKATKLAKELGRLINEKIGSCAELESKCYIKESLMRKCLNLKRTVTRDMLAKFCVGIGLGLEETDKLFILQGFRLDPENNLLDAVVVDAMKCGDDISVFYEECKKYNLTDRTLAFDE